MDSTKATADSGAAIFLSPVPSNNPTDSLNWSTRRKWSIMIILGFTTGAALSMENFLTNLTPELYRKFPDEPVSAIHRLLNVIVPMVGPGALIFVPLGVVYGRRLSLLLSLLVLLASTLWAGLTTSFSSLYAARIIQGLACGPTDALFLTVIQDCTFIHERGGMLGAVVMLQLALQSGLSIIVTYVSIHVSLTWTFILYACVIAVCIVLMFFFMPETSRSKFEQESLTPITISEFQQSRQLMRKMTWKESLAVWSGHSQRANEAFLHIFQQILLALTSTVYWWCILMTTITTGAPYSWPSANVALINLSVFPAAFLNWFITGWASDKLVLRFVRGNTEAMLPEYRLIPLVFPVICAITGHIAFGCLAQHYLVTNPGGPQVHWFALVVISCLQYIGFGGVLEVVLTFLGATADPNQSLAIMTAVTVIRDIASFGISYGTYDFSVKVGYAASFGIYAMLIGVIAFGAIPIILIGVRPRVSVS
ncbi:hypothetical protein N7490_005888 [Penicillium lividum]|nr:hypothetical protein N7490_005888 [Penicillium lividum]